MSDIQDLDGPNPVDMQVGLRVRIRRKILGMSQESLAAALGLSFQQVQKYERGANRISASKLYAIAMILQVPVGFFFEGLPDPVGDDPNPEAEEASRTIQTFLATPEGVELAALFPRIERGQIRRQVLDLTRALAAEEHLPQIGVG